MSGTWDDILEIANRQGMVSTGDVRALGLVPENLNRMASLGLLVRVGRGLYEAPNADPSEDTSYIEIAKSFPAGVICLLSALRIHGVGSQMPGEVWVAFPRGHRKPKSKMTTIHAVSMSADNYALGIESRVVRGVSIKVYSLEKTLVDCFRLRRFIGHDVGVEALRDAVRGRHIDLSGLLMIADQLHTKRLIQPYLESLV